MENTHSESEKDQPSDSGISLEPDNVDGSSNNEVPKNEVPSPEVKKKNKKVKKFIKKANFYIVMLVLLILIVLTIGILSYSANKKSGGASIKNQNLSQNTLDQLANSDVTVGNNSTILSVESSAVFSGQVLIKQGVQVAGNLVVGGISNLNELNVTGTSQLAETNVSKDLSVSGNLALQGSLTANKSLQVNGPVNISGALSAPQITTNSLLINGLLTLTHGISTNGGIPSRSGGSALGGGGTVSISGTNTAGDVAINTGSGPSAGCFVTVTFTAPYPVIPYVIVSPIGASAGGISYYVNKSSSNFSICSNSTPAGNSSFGFDYFVID